MSSLVQARPPEAGFYPERRAPEESGPDRWFRDALGLLTRARGRRPGRLGSIASEVNRMEKPLMALSDVELLRAAAGLRVALRGRDGLGAEGVARSFALVREMARRHVAMRPFDVQIIGGWVLLSGMVAEMQTGEGKTLTATLPACTLALAGIPVHIITVNDYLATRDAGWMGPLYRALGLTVGTVTQGMGLEERRRAYRCDVTYCTNKEIVFDYLRDRLELGRRPGPIQARLDRLSTSVSPFDRLRLRGLHFAIVDEADSVLIDEARVPLIISGAGSDTYEAAVYRQAMEIADRLQAGEDFKTDAARRNLEWTEAGRVRLEALSRPAGAFWSSRPRREELVRLALTARHLYDRDKDYVVKAGKVVIVDEYTGRLMPGRAWEGGLHQLIETKECCELTVRTEVLARISYQRFFRRYLRLAGMTGTALEAAREFWSVYRLPVVRVPTNRPLRRRGLPIRIHRRLGDKWSAVVARIAALHAAGRPVLVGTRTVAASERLAGLLDQAGIPCRVLNALQDEEEAAIIAQAGERGRVTVATNMAGRGTDIRLGPGVGDFGGLHVIATELHDARRIDRQLFGRCGRQGDPGTYEAIVSLEDDLIQAHRANRPAWRRSARSALSLFGGWTGRGAFRRAQRWFERTHLLMRRDLLKIDESVDRALAFSGRGE